MMRDLYFAALLSASLVVGAANVACAQVAESPVPAVTEAAGNGARVIKIVNVPAALIAYRLDPVHNARPTRLGAEATGNANDNVAFALPVGIEQVVSIDSQNVLLIAYKQGSERSVRELQDLIAVLDQPFRQIEIEARIVEMSPDDAKTFDVDFGPQQSEAKAENAPQIGLVRGNAMARLNALIADDKAKVLRSPRITLDDKFNGQLTLAEPLTIALTHPANGDKPETTSQVNTSPALLLKVATIVNEDKTLSFALDVVRETTPATGAATRESLTAATFKALDGDVWILKNLPFPINRQNYRVPIYGKIPAVGSLFRSKSQTLVFVTMRVEREGEK